MPEHHQCVLFSFAALRPLKIFPVLLSALLLTLAVPSGILAQTQSYQISAGPLEDALNSLAVQSGITLGFPSEMVEGKHSTGLQGSYTVQQALEQLLDGSGLEVFHDNGGYRIRPAQATGASTPQEQESVTLEPMHVRAHVDSQETTEGTGSYTIGATSTATRLNLSFRDTPQSVSVITREMIDDFGLKSIDQVMENVTGVNMAAFEQARSEYSARGFLIDNLQIDGVANTWDAGWTAGQTQTSMAMFDRVEVVRGASGLISGAGNPSAAVNMVRKRANSKELSGTVRASAGSWDARELEADISTPVTADGAVRARIVGSYSEADSFTDHYNWDKTLFYGVVNADVSDNTLLTVGVSRQDNGQSGAMWGALPTWFSDGSRTDWSRSKTTAPKWSYWDSVQEMQFLTLEHRFDNGIKTYASVSHSENTADAKLLYLYGTVDPVDGTGLNAWPGWYETSRKQDNIDLYASFPIEAGGRSHEVLTGLMHSKQTFVAHSRAADWSTISPTGNFFEWDGSYQEPTWEAKGLYEKFDNTQTGVYAVGRFSLTDSLRLIAGNRVTNWERKGTGYGGVAYKIDHDSIMTPYAGLIYDLDENHSTYVSYTDIFNPQSERDKNGDYLDPIEGKNYEIGVKGEYLAGRLNAGLTVFRIEQDNVAQADGANLVPGTIDQAYRAARGATSEGFEIEISGEPMDRLNITLGYSQFEAEDRDGQDINTHYPRKTANLSGKYQWGKFSFGSSLNWRDKGYAKQDNPITGDPERLTQKAFTLVNLMGQYQHTAALSAQLNINNLFDETYYNQIGFFESYGYGAPRNLMLSMSYTF